MPYMQIGAKALAEPTLVKRLRVELLLLSSALAVALWMRIEASTPGTMAHLPFVFEDLLKTIEHVILDVGNACNHGIRDFFLRMSSG